MSVLRSCIALCYVLPMTAGEELDGIMRDLDATGDAWERAGYPYEGPEFEAREAVFRRLHAWNDARDSAKLGRR